MQKERTGLYVYVLTNLYAQIDGSLLFTLFLHLAVNPNDALQVRVELQHLFSITSGFERYILRFVSFFFHCVSYVEIVAITKESAYSDATDEDGEIYNKTDISNSNNHKKIIK